MGINAPFLETPDEDLICQICHGVLDKPVTNCQQGCASVFGCGGFCVGLVVGTRPQKSGVRWGCVHSPPHTIDPCAPRSIKSHRQAHILRRVHQGLDAAAQAQRERRRRRRQRQGGGAAALPRLHAPGGGGGACVTCTQGVECGEGVVCCRWYGGMVAELCV